VLGGNGAQWWHHMIRKRCHRGFQVEFFYFMVSMATKHQLMVKKSRLNREILVGQQVSYQHSCHLADRSVPSVLP
jgi:hypothetical protein